MSYDLNPQIDIVGEMNLHEGYNEIVEKLNDEINRKDANIIAIECYPGTFEHEVFENLVNRLKPELIIHSNDIYLTNEQVTNQIQYNLTDDRVFGVMSHHSMEEFINQKLLKETVKKIDANSGKRIIVYGVGASLITETDLLIYTNLARWEIQQRFREKSISNWKADNYDEDLLRKIKRGYYFEWRIADKLKKSLFNKIDFMIDVNKRNKPKMITGQDYQRAISQVVKRPFRLVPYLDSGIWGGKWMQEKFDVYKNRDNLAWCFDGVPEENSLYLNINNRKFEMPAIDVVYQQPALLLGEKVYGRYGTSFPIRFDYLDTMDGGNLSLQVHPKVEYAQETFGIPYTQDESYYVMETGDDASVYLGVKKNVDKQNLINALELAQEKGSHFPDTEYIYRKKIKKHDHYSIPAGTIHSSGKNSVVLEISSTPNRFTFKLWDWGRTDVDGKPRPIHLEHGKKNIDFTRDEDWVDTEVSNKFRVVNKGDGWIEEQTGLHKLEPIETRRHWFSKEVLHETHGSVNVLNLVEGEEIVVRSLDDFFEPFIIHYGETFIIPENIKKYIVEPHGPSIGKEVATIKAFIR